MCTADHVLQVRGSKSLMFAVPALVVIFIYEYMVVA